MTGCVTSVREHRLAGALPARDACHVATPKNAP